MDQAGAEVQPRTVYVTTMAATWVRARMPMPSTLPISNCAGRMAASSTSITRLAFSSLTPTAIRAP